MKEKFDGAKVGDRVWSSQYGWCTVTCVSENTIVIFIKKTNTEKRYFKDGKCFTGDAYPTLFWNEFHIPTYDEDQKPFDLIGFLKENFKPKEYKKDEENYYIYFDHIDEKWNHNCSTFAERFDIYFEYTTNEIVEVLTKNKIKPEQTRQAFKEIGWI